MLGAGCRVLVAGCSALLKVEALLLNSTSFCLLDKVGDRAVAPESLDTLGRLDVSEAH